MLHDAYDIFFETLGNRRRLKIVEELIKGSKSVSQIVKAAGFEQSNVSHNLRRLERCGFVKAEKEGKKRVYSLNKETIQPLMLLINKHVNKFCKNCLKEGI